jgi:hypothetical protein
MNERFNRLSIKMFLKNIFFMMQDDMHKDVDRLKYDMHRIITDLDTYDLKLKILVFKILKYFEEHLEFCAEFEAELNYLRNSPVSIVFPYKQLKTLDHVQSGFDDVLKLAFVVHNEKRLYFPKGYSIEMAVSTYRNFIEKENILGGNFTEKAPHQYETDTFCINEGDIIYDIGAAEGLFTLNKIEMVKKAYLVESDPLWIEALCATFAPYKDKVCIINKLITDRDSENSITLTSLLENNISQPTFIKFDIEGYETLVIKSSQDILSKLTNTRIVCCAYHKQIDADELEKTFKALKYEVEFSDGYVLFIFDTLLPPFFRKGIIRVKK